MPSTERKLRVFLCHASQDKPIVRELYQRLLAEGWIDPWLDEEKLLPGQDWDMEIEKAVEAADVVIVCLSNNSITKEGYVQKELKFVLDIALEKEEGAVFIIPLRLDDCQVPRRIRSWHYVNYFPQSQRRFAFDRILISIRLCAKTHGIAMETPSSQEFADLNILMTEVTSTSSEFSKIEHHTIKEFLLGTWEIVEINNGTLMPIDTSIFNDPESDNFGGSFSFSITIFHDDRFQFHIKVKSTSYRILNFFSSTMPGTFTLAIENPTEPAVFSIFPDIENFVTGIGFIKFKNPFINLDSNISEIRFLLHFLDKDTIGVNNFREDRINSGIIPFSAFWVRK